MSFLSPVLASPQPFRAAPAGVLFRARPLRALLLPVLLACATTARAGTFTEDFTSTSYADLAQTSAHWNVTDGSLELYPCEVVPAGSLAVAGAAPVSVVPFGDLLFLAAGSSGLHVVDVSDPGAPALLATVAVAGEARDLAIAGDVAFLAAGSAGVRVLDVSDPTSAGEIGSAALADSALAVVARGNRVYVAQAGAGFAILAVTDPANPVLLGQLPAPGNTRDLAIAGTHAVLASETVLHVVDVKNPLSPSITGSTATPGDARAVVLSGFHALVADGAAGLTMVDVSDAGAPAVVATLALDDEIVGVHVDGDVAFLAGATRGVLAVDVSDPSNPKLIGREGNSGLVITGVNALLRAGRHVFAAGAGAGEGFRVLDVADAVLPPEPLGEYDTPGSSFGLDVQGDAAWIADFAGGVRVLDVSDPSAPSLLAVQPTSGNAHDVFLDGDRAYVAAGAAGLLVLDATNPSTPSLLGGVALSEDAREVVADGEYAYVATRLAGLSVVDVRDPSSPAVVATYPTPGIAFGVAISGDLLLVANDLAGLLLFDVSDPAHPTVLGQYDSSGQSFGVTVAGDLAFLADGSSGLRVIDIGDPANPALLGTYDTPHLAYNVAVAGDLAFVADGLSGLRVVDVSDPSAPFLAGFFNTPEYALDVRVTGNVVHVANEDTGLLTFRVFRHRPDTTNDAARSLIVHHADEPVQRIRLTTAQTDSIRWEVSADGGGAWEEMPADGGWRDLAAPGFDLLWRATLYDADPGAPTSCDWLELEWATVATGVAAETLPPDLTLLHAPRPNPAAARAVTLAFDLPAGGATARLDIFDTAGRRRRTITDRFHVAGRHVMIWNGDDDAGRPVAPGVYFVHLRTPDGTQARKITLLP